MTFEANALAVPARPDWTSKAIRWRSLIKRSSDPTFPAASAMALDHISDGVLIADMRMRGHPIVQVNSAFEAITGYSP
ncbi:PAS domain-containing protein [Methylopila sp. Yamaguchi]|uniref:PAS domain-containing protein n=1 Tax=Methylopila sp. Yamaguchi TaxID=1437817 RepID=UPI000CBD72C7|nr:PAS domain-containing protein [Methylopila sp. Yamaguchi]GBD50141.1 hypothetical protein METY_3354 [Methylopila sp. Yamaguchi]